MNKEQLAEILKVIKKDSYVEGYQATDAQAMGLLISRYFEWDGIQIMEASESALEDANFHRECAIVHELRKIAERD